MSKRSDFMAQAEAARTMNIEKSDKFATSVDNLVETIGKSIDAPKDTFFKEQSEENKENSINEPIEVKNVSVSPDLIKNLRSKELKTVHVNLLVPESLRQKITTFAKQRGVSVNALVNEILTNAFE